MDRLLPSSFNKYTFSPKNCPSMTSMSFYDLSYLFDWYFPFFKRLEFFQNPECSQEKTFKEHPMFLFSTSSFLPSLKSVLKKNATFFSKSSTLIGWRCPTIYSSSWGKFANFGYKTFKPFKLLISQKKWLESQREKCTSWLMILHQHWNTGGRKNNSRWIR